MPEHLSNSTTRTIGISQYEADPEATDPISFDFVKAAIDKRDFGQDQFPTKEDGTIKPTPPVFCIDFDNLAVFHGYSEPIYNDLGLRNSHLEEELRRFDLENIYLRGNNTANVNRIQNICNNYNMLQQEFYQAQLALETTQH